MEATAILLSQNWNFKSCLHDYSCDVESLFHKCNYAGCVDMHIDKNTCTYTCCCRQHLAQTISSRFFVKLSQIKFFNFQIFFASHSHLSLTRTKSYLASAYRGNKLFTNEQSSIDEILNFEINCFFLFAADNRISSACLTLSRRNLKFNPSL